MILADPGSKQTASGPRAGPRRDAASSGGGPPVPAEEGGGAHVLATFGGPTLFLVLDLADHQLLIVARLDDVVVLLVNAHRDRRRCPTKVLWSRTHVRTSSIHRR